MASGVTNRGKFLAMDIALRGATPPTAFKMLLCTATTTPDVDTNLITDLEEIANGNGYTQGTGIAVERSAVGFDVATEDDTLDRAHFEIKDLQFLASGGFLPSDQVGARWGALCDDAATPNVWAWFDLGAPRVVSDGQPLNLIDSTINANTP